MGVAGFLLPGQAEAAVFTPSYVHNCAAPTVYAGRVTYYDNTVLGMLNCSYPKATIPTDTQNGQTGTFYSAVATHLYNTNMCGACAEITSVSGGLATGAKITVPISDQCPKATNATHCYDGSNHLDLSMAAFRALNAGNLVTGVFNVSWKVVPCPAKFMSTKGQLGANMTYVFKDSASQWYAPIQIRDYPLPIHQVDFGTSISGPWTTTTWQDFNFWLPTSGTWTTVYLRIQDTAGNTTYHGPISCCGSQFPTAQDSATSAVYANVPGAQQPGCGAAGSPTSTPSRTATRTASASATRTPSPSATRTASPSLTVSPTRTATLTASASRTITLTGSPSSTRTATPSATPVANTATVTPSRTPSPTPSATLTRSPTPTFTALANSATPTPTRSPTASSTATLTVSPTRTASPTATLSWTPAPGSPTSTPTITLTRTVTPTATPSGTPVPGSPTSTPTRTATQTSSPTSSLTSTVSPTPSFTRTRTVTPSVTLSSTSVPVGSTATATPTVSPTFSSSPTLTSTPTLIIGPLTSSPTPTSAPSANNPTDLEILESHPYPNPNPGSISVLLNGPAESLELKVYTAAMVAVGSSQRGASLGGWVQIPLPDGIKNSASAGLYYYVVSGRNGGKRAKAPHSGKLFIIK